jgi:hypothetical protein
MQINFEISKAHICQDNVCFKPFFVLVKNMADKVILGLPLDDDRLITYPLDENVNLSF